jgi:two-component system, NarL family, sensor kinase
VAKEETTKNSNPANPTSHGAARAAKASNSRNNHSAYENVFREMLDILEAGAAVVTPDGKIIYANHRFASVFGIPPLRNLRDWDLRTALCVDSWNGMSIALSEAIREPISGELKLHVAGEGVRTIRLSLHPLNSSAEPTIAIVADEVTELVEANSALQESQLSLRALSARILQVQDDERRRMARDLHDTTGQELVALNFTLQTLEKQITDGNDSARESLQEALATANKIGTQIRTLSYMLHPPLLDELGLGSAIECYVEGLTKRSELDVTLDIPQKLPRLPQEKEIALFRVIQAALTNVVRHSDSKKAWIRVVVRDGMVEARIRDKGKGIEPAALARISDASKNLGLGISGMRERLRQFGGKLDISSGKLGTQVIGILPITTGELVVKPDVGTAESGEPASAGRKRILVVDDHEVVRRGVRSLFDGQPDLEICGEAVNGEEALTKVDELRPDIIILDLSMPQFGGLSVARAIRARGCLAKILAFSSHSYQGLENIIQSAGCDGFVLKTYAGKDLVFGVRELLAGRNFYGNRLQRTTSA